jgi:hypothetical protein
MKIFGLVILVPLCTFSHLGSSGGNAVAATASFLFFSSVLALYFYPSICAMKQEKRIRRSIFKLNLIAGWTVIGWLLAFYRALVQPLTDD